MLYNIRIYIICETLYCKVQRGNLKGFYLLETVYELLHA